MLFRFHCSRCKTLLEIGVRMVGNPINCPICKGEMIVPSFSDQRPAHAPVAAAQDGREPSATPAAAANPVANKSPRQAPPAKGTRAKWTPRQLVAGTCAVLVLAAAGVLATLHRPAPVPAPADDEQVAASIAGHSGQPGPPGPVEAAGLEDEIAELATPVDEKSDEGRLLPRRLVAVGLSNVKPSVPAKTPAGQHKSSIVRPASPAASSAAKPAPLAAARAAPLTPSEGTAALSVKRRRKVSEDELRRQLLRMPEVSLERGYFAALVATYRSAIRQQVADNGWLNFDPTFLVQVYPGLKPMPLRYGKACRLDRKAAATLDLLSRKLRVYLATKAPPDAHHKRPNPVLLRESLRLEMHGKNPEWLRAGAIPALMQQLMPEDRPIRLMLVDLLAEIPDRQASIALAQRAVFDLSAEVRTAAIEALRGRPRNDYRYVFLKALRYPWAPAADHAAEALAALEDHEAVPMLVSLLKKPDPCAPVQAGSRRVVPQVVRVNHLANCLMCHPPSVTYNDPVPGVVPAVTWLYPVRDPSQGQALINGMNVFTSSTTSTGTTVQTGCHNYAATSSTSSVTIGPPGQATSPTSKSANPPPQVNVSTTTTTANVAKDVNVTTTTTTTSTSRFVKNRRMAPPQMSTVRLPLLVRGDVTYLRQDFSVPQPVVQPDNSGPLDMRFDYLVRMRPLSADDSHLVTSEPGDDPRYAQRESVLFALRELTGKDAGDATADWVRLFPRTAVDVRAIRLSDAVAQAPAGEKHRLLAELREGKGLLYTRALALAISHVSGDAQAEARAMLARRLTRMTAATLQAKLQDDNPETRRAAAVACAMKESTDHVPELIDLLADREAEVADAAHQALKSLSGRDFGPSQPTVPADRARAAEAWNGWYEKLGRQ